MAVLDISQSSVLGITRNAAVMTLSTAALLALTYAVLNLGGIDPDI